MERLIVCLLCLSSVWIRLEAQPIVVNDLPTLNQLPVNAIHRVFQDSEGYMWYGTVDGLCRDDGYRVQVFRADINTPKAMNDNAIVCITEDSSGRIWFGTDNGAYILDKTDYSIMPLDEDRLKNKTIDALYTTSDGCVWLVHQGILVRYDNNGNRQKEYGIHDANGCLPVGYLCESRRHEIYITVGQSTLFYYDANRDDFFPYKETSHPFELYQIKQDVHNEYFWIVAKEGNILRFNPCSSDSTFVHYSWPVDVHRLPSEVIYNMTQDGIYGYLWVITNCRMLVFAPQPDGTLRSLPEYGKLLPTNCMLSEALYSKGCLWVAAFDRNSFLIHLTGNNIQHHDLPALHRTPAVMAVCDAGDGMLWMMQERCGLVLYDLQGNRAAIHTDFAGMTPLRLVTGRELAEAKYAGGVWVARDKDLEVYRVTRQGMVMKPGETVKLERYVPSTAFVTELYEDGSDCLWIGLSEGLCRYHVKKRELMRFYADVGHVTGIEETMGDSVLVCTKEGRLHHFASDGRLCYTVSGDIPYTCLTFAPNGTVWLGSDEGGVYAYKPMTHDLADYSKACGMNGDQVNRIVADNYSHVWIDTNGKLTEFNPDNGSFRIYRTTDGFLQLRRLLPTAACRMRDGRLCFGGIPGVCMVMPSNSLDLPMSRTQTSITDICLQGRSLLFHHRCTGDSNHFITLCPEDRNLEISFSSFNHRYASKVRYAYRMQGIDSDWVYGKVGQSSAFYNSLPKGTFVFQVRATDENGLWSGEVTTLTIHRKPAFYETWWAYLAYICLSLLAINGVFYLYLHRVEKKNNELWADSKEMMHMRAYLDSPVNLPDPEFVRLDTLLLEKATKVVEANLAEPDFDVNALATAVCMSRSTLTRKLKTITGQTPLEFIRHIKMQHARCLLEDKDRSVAEVAASLGYFNRKYFTNCFKEEFGVTPSDFQKSIGS